MKNVKKRTGLFTTKDTKATKDQMYKEPLSLCPWCPLWLRVPVFFAVFALFAVFARSAAAQTDYHIGAQDVLMITVFGEPDLAGKFTVEQEGTFTFPLIGRVKAGGVTLRALV